MPHSRDKEPRRVNKTFSNVPKLPKPGTSPGVMESMRFGAQKFLSDDDLLVNLLRDTPATLLSAAEPGAVHLLNKLPLGMVREKVLGLFGREDSPKLFGSPKE